MEFWPDEFVDKKWDREFLVIQGNRFEIHKGIIQRPPLIKSQNQTNKLTNSLFHYLIFLEKRRSENLKKKDKWEIQNVKSLITTNIIIGF